MSLYNALFGKNKHADVLLRMLNIDQPDKKYSSGRFRDIYLNEDGTKIILYTRNGGGNRREYQYVFDNLSQHPNYIKDYDDSFDSTYAYIEFTVPVAYRDDISSLVTGEKPKNVSERFQQLFSDMDSGKTTEETERAKEVGKKIFSDIEKKPEGGIIVVDEKDGEGENKQ